MWKDHFVELQSTFFLITEIGDDSSEHSRADAENAQNDTKNSTPTIKE